MTTYQVAGVASFTHSSVAAHFSATNTLDTPLVLRMFPWGDYFSRDGGWLPAVARAVARTLSRLRRRQRALDLNIDPRTAEELLDEHESELGLTDGSALSLAARRLRVLGKRRANTPGDDESLINATYYEDLAKSIGYADAVVTDAGDPLTCVDQCIDPLMGGGWLLTFKLTATSLGAELDSVLEELVEGELLGGWHVIFELS